MRILLIIVAFIGIPAQAAWTLDNASSQFSFVTIKAQNVAEVHTFNELSGTVAATGDATVSITLASVDTLIPIRDERMRELLFRTDLFPVATASTRLNVAELEALPVGDSQRLSAELVLNLNDAEISVTTSLLISRLASDRMQVVTLKPVIINAASLSLAEGVEQLREIAGLPSISQAVPVTFVLQFVDAP